MTYFVTGATGFLGRFLLEALLNRQAGDPSGRITALVRESSRPRLEALIARLDGDERVDIVVGDLTEPRLGLRDEDVARLQRHGRPTSSTSPPSTT